MAPSISPLPSLREELERETAQSAAVVSRLRLYGVTALCALTLLLGLGLNLRSWQGNEPWFVAYWVATAATWMASRRSERFARVAMLAVAFVDAPMAFVIQYAAFAKSSSPVGVAGFSLGVFGLLVVLSALSLRSWYIWTTAAIGVVLEVTLQTLAGVSVGSRVAGAIVLGLVALACSYSRWRLAELVARVQRDLAERQKAERALQHAGRVMAAGTLAASVAHEIKNPLVTVLGGLEIADRLARRRADAPELMENIELAREAADRIRVIVKDMTAFARADDDVAPDLDVNALLHRALAMADPALRHHVRVVRDFGADVRCSGGARRIEQVFLNLFLNAAQAMPDEPSAMPRNELRVSSRRLDDGRACVEVADTGVGMPADALARVFEAFYTTKREGTGLGLFISRGIVEGFGGEITAESAPGQGTRFRVVLRGAT